jgi:dipeptidase E
MRRLVLASSLSSGFPKIAAELSAHARGPNLLFVPTAARGEGWEPDPSTDIKPFEDLGFKVEIFDLAGRSGDEVEGALSRSQAVVVCGGNTFYLLHHMKESGFFDALPRYLEAGLVYVGSSAGAIVATPDIGYASTVDDRSKGGPLGDGGFGYIDRPILPHMDHEAFSEAVAVIACDFEIDGVEYHGLNEDQVLLAVGTDVRVL